MHGQGGVPQTAAAPVPTASAAVGGGDGAAKGRADTKIRLRSAPPNAQKTTFLRPAFASCKRTKSIVSPPDAMPCTLDILLRTQGDVALARPPVADPSHRLPCREDAPAAKGTAFDRALTGDARAPPVVGAHRHAPASACKHRFKPVVGQFRPTLTQAALLDREPLTWMALAPTRRRARPWGLGPH